MKAKICFRWNDNNVAEIKLIQTGVDSFTVVYGLQTKKSLRYVAAATELGACIMHALACDGKLDNRERGEK